MRVTSISYSRRSYPPTLQSSSPSSLAANTHVYHLDPLSVRWGTLLPSRSPPSHGRSTSLYLHNSHPSLLCVHSWYTLATSCLSRTSSRLRKDDLELAPFSYQQNLWSMATAPQRWVHSIVTKYVIYISLELISTVAGIYLHPRKAQRFKSPLGYTCLGLLLN